MTPPPGCSFQNGCPRRSAQQASGANDCSETWLSPQCVTASSRFLDDLNMKSVPPLETTKSLFAICPTTAWASSLVPEHCNKSPISLSRVIYLLFSLNSTTSHLTPSS